jgi:hypothetical protein
MNKDARTFGQDLMRGEHTVGKRKARSANLTQFPAAADTVRTAPIWSRR